MQRVGVLVDNNSAFWSRYVSHYITKGSLKRRHEIHSFLPEERIINLLPDYDVSASVDGVDLRIL